MTSAAHTLARALPIPAGAGLARTLVERNYRVFRNNWMTLVSGIFEPIFYLYSIGIGLGAMIGTVDIGGRAVDYVVFIAPAMMASAAMNGAVFDATFNVFFKLKYAKTYDSILATPMGPRDVAVGEIAWALLRGAVYAVAFLVVAAISGATTSWWSVLAVPAATLIGLAFAAIGMAVTTYLRSWQDFDFVQLAIMPMFLFSATFYPLSTYSESLQWVVQATPLYHGVAMIRDLWLGDVGPGIFVHVGYLLAMGAVGVLWASRRIERLLLR
jgi:lipooligosaccharide transport system permease protein